MQARPLTPLMFIEQLPQMPSLHDFLNDNVGSCLLFISISTSNTMVPHLFKSILKLCNFGLFNGFSGFHLYTFIILQFGDIFFI